MNMLAPEKAQKSFYILTWVVSLGIGWRTFGASIVNAICRLCDIDPIVTFENNLDVFQELTSLAMAMLAAMVGTKGVDRYIDYRSCNYRNPESRTRKSDKDLTDNTVQHKGK